jgi:hypothetical protein
MVEFVPSPQSQSSTHGDKQHPNEISLPLDNSLYRSDLTDTGILEVTFTGITFARNSICFEGIRFNVSSISISPPCQDPSSDISTYHYCVIPRQAEGIVISNEANESLQFIAFEFGSQLTRIDSLAFCHISNLRSICLPMSVETIGKGAFMMCSNLSLLVFERSSKLTRIEKDTFYWCSSLKSVRLPASLQFLHPTALPRQEVLRITIEEGSLNFRVSGGFLMDFTGATVFRYFGVGGNLTLGVEIETLGVRCFSQYSGISSLIFERGSKLKRIEALALSHCSGLKSICIPASVEILCAGCFEECSSLSSLTFESESQLTEIEANVFSGCSSLQSLSIPASLKKIHGSAFAGSGIAMITVEEGNANFAFCGDFLINVPAASIVRYFGLQEEMTLTSEIDTLCTGYFSPSSLTLEPGSKLVRIEAGAFARLSSLKSILIPASVESLGDECFYECRSLSSVTFESESKLVRIEARAFARLSNLKSISIPASVESLGDDCFNMCCFLSSVTFDSRSNLVRIGSGAFCSVSELTSISIPASVESLGDHCFCGCTSLESVRFASASKRVRIGASAFADSWSLGSISIPASVESLGDECFCSCWALSSMTFESGSKLVQIHARAFAGCGSLKSIAIPRSIRELVKDWALESSLEQVTFESAASLQRMLDGDLVDLSGSFVIKIDECDSDIDSLGSSIGRRFNHFSHLVH